MPLERKRPAIDFSLEHVIGITLTSFCLTPKVISFYTCQLKKVFQSIQSTKFILFPEVREIPFRPLYPHVISDPCTENKNIAGPDLDVLLREPLFILKRG